MMVQLTSDRGLLSSLKWVKSRFLADDSTKPAFHFRLIRMKLLNLGLSLTLSGFFIPLISVFAVEPKKGELPDLRITSLRDSPSGTQLLPHIASPWSKHESKLIPMSPLAHSNSKNPINLTGKSTQRLRRKIQEMKSHQTRDLRIHELPVGAFPSVASVGTQEIFKTTSYSEANLIAPFKTFISVGIHPVLGEGWIDPASVIWYDLAIDPQTQHPLELTQIEAHRFCSQHRMRLPKEEDFKRLRLYLHTSSDPHKHEVFPHFRGHRFWTSSVLNQELSSQGIVFNGDRETFFPSSQDSKYQVHCIHGARRSQAIQF